MRRGRIKRILFSLIVIQLIIINSIGATVKESPLYNFKSFNFDTKKVTYDESEPVFMYRNGPQVMMPNEYKQPKIQFRSAWISTVANIDIGNVTSDDSLSAEEELKQNYNRILQTYDEYNLNAVIFQVSPMLDAWYKSEFAPWSQYLHRGGGDYTFQGKDPGFGDFNPLEWMIEETHKRGMEFHAWFNPYRVTNNSSDERSKKEKLSDLSEDNFARKNPDLVYEFQNKLFLDPGEPEVIDYICDRVAEISENYNVDAIHFDDYFYPYSYSNNGKTIYFYKENIDKETFLENNRGFGEYNDKNISNWRENNINLLISNVKSRIDEINKKNHKAIQFGVSPAGIWGHAESQEGGSLTSDGGISTLRDQFADTKKWAEEGWIDYLVPQVYWAFNNSSSPYGELVDWWSEQFEKIDECQLYIGHPYYKITETANDKNFMNPYEIANQLRFNQKYNNILGSVFFSLRKLYPQNVENKGDKYDVLNNCNSILKSEYLKYKSNIPSKKWLDSFNTKAVKNLTAIKKNSENILTWKDNNKDSKFYCIYRQKGRLDSVDIDNPENLIARFGVKLGEKFIDNNIDLENDYTYAVTIVDNSGVESEEAIAVSSLGGVITKEKSLKSLVLMIIGVVCLGVLYYLFEKKNIF